MTTKNFDKQTFVELVLPIVLLNLVGELCPHTRLPVSEIHHYDLKSVFTPDTHIRSFPLDQQLTRIVHTMKSVNYIYLCDLSYHVCDNRPGYI